MKNLIWIVPLALIAIVGYTAMDSYNDFVSLDEGVDGKWADVETTYQRRFDLIPNLVATVKGVAEFEQETLTAVTEARASAFNAANPICDGYDESELAEDVDLEAMDARRREGVTAGIDNAYELFRVRIVDSWRCAPPPGRPRPPGATRPVPAW